MAHRHEQWLLELTSIPTAAGREDRVIAWIENWVARRPNVEMLRDRFGNLLLQRRGARNSSGKRRRAAPPIYINAHLDHPAFVVTEVIGPRKIRADFRGGVDEKYFRGTEVLLHASRATDRKPPVGRIVKLEPPPPAPPPVPARALADKKAGIFRLDKRVTVQFAGPVAAKPGDILTWNIPPAHIRGDLLHAPACDDLAAVAAALSAFDVLLRRRGSAKPGGRGARPDADVRVFLTRAEEVGLVGAIAACKAGLIPRNARILALENSKSFSDSPLGAGPIVRVGDKTSSFHPELTYRVGQIAGDLAAADKTFRWQRKLMAGGTCEATAYQAYGFVVTCLCLPLGNYHNMNEAKGRIDAEVISRSDYRGLIRLLVATVQRLDDPKRSPSLRKRLDELLARRRGILGPG